MSNLDITSDTLSSRNDLFRLCLNKGIILLIIVLTFGCTETPDDPAIQKTVNITEVTEAEKIIETEDVEKLDETTEPEITKEVSLTKEVTTGVVETPKSTTTSIIARPINDLDAFKDTLYPTLVENCGLCHGRLPGISFASTDFNVAFQTIMSNALANFTMVDRSLIVAKPLTEHYCTFPTCQIRSDEIQAGIVAWANRMANRETVAEIVKQSEIVVGNTKTPDSVVGVVDQTKKITDPNQENTKKDPTIVINTPPKVVEEVVTEISLFQKNLHPVLVDQCATCHESLVVPNFANNDANVAYAVITSNTLVNLNNPDSSRLVAKPLTLHKCVATICQTWSDNIKSGITNWANDLAESFPNVVVVDPRITSDTLTFADAIKDQGNGRIEDAIIAKYEFKTGTGTTVFDTSGIAPSLDLSLSENVNWLVARGIEITDPNEAGVTKLVGDPSTSRKLYDRIAAEGGSKQYSIEAWIINQSVALSGPARIVSYSFDAQNRNFTMGQNTRYYNFRNRSDMTGLNGSSPSLETNNDNNDLKEQLQHVVFTFTESEGRKIYVDGIETSYENVAMDEAVPASILDWDDSYSFVLGNELMVQRQWLGKMLFVAIHDRALTREEVIQNTVEGIEDKFILEFDVSSLLDASGLTKSSIKIVVSELDDFSYIFSSPSLITDIANPNIPVKNLRIVVNGNIPVAAQAFRGIDLTVMASDTSLSTLGAVIPKENGPETDMFSLEFEQLGINSNVEIAQIPVFPIDTSTNPPTPEFGLRTFEQINNTMSVLTGVEKSVTMDSYLTLKEQLPSTPNLDAFVSSQQIGIAKLALDYCDAMVESVALRTDFFGDTFEFDFPVATAFSDQTKRDIIIDNLVTKLIGIDMNRQPTLVEIKPVINSLIDELSVCPVVADCDAVRTRAIVKSSCSAVLASAAITIN